jgi:glc operon protein GlcG
MENIEMQTTINKLFDEIETLIPHYMTMPEEKNISMGNLAVCVIDDNGIVYGRMFGTDKPG